MFMDAKGRYYYELNTGQELEPSEVDGIETIRGLDSVDDCWESCASRCGGCLPLLQQCFFVFCHAFWFCRCPSRRYVDDTPQSERPNIV